MLVTPLLAIAVCTEEADESTVVTMCFTLSRSQHFKFKSLHGYGDNGDLVTYLQSVRPVSFIDRNLISDNSAG